MIQASVNTLSVQRFFFNRWNSMHYVHIFAWNFTDLKLKLKSVKKIWYIGWIDEQVKYYLYGWACISWWDYDHSRLCLLFLLLHRKYLRDRRRVVLRWQYNERSFLETSKEEIVTRIRDVPDVRCMKWNNDEKIGYETKAYLGSPSNDTVQSCDRTHRIRRTPRACPYFPFVLVWCRSDCRTKYLTNEIETKKSD